ncbi:unnamed protein product, partial [Polarella glacialis]
PEGAPLLRLGCLAGILLGATSGSLHGVAMALRKCAGGSKASYWTQWQWWLGIACDGVAGVLFMASSPFVPAVLLLPVVAVSQMSSGYVIGVCCLGESSSKRAGLGLLCAVLGVVILEGSGQGEAAPAPLSTFFVQWARPQFVL